MSNEMWTSTMAHDLIHNWMKELAHILFNSRRWHRREQSNDGRMHDAIYKAISLEKPDCWQALVLEWPHDSKEGDHKIAYTRSDEHGDADRQTVTPVSKYLTRHFSRLRSDQIRNIAALYVEAEFKIVRTMGEMLDIIVKGPNSCMSGDEEGFPYLQGKHPYEAYDPKYGWHMACTMEGGVYTGRALLNDDVYVRTYRGREGSSYSDSDERLNAWLQEEGYSKASGWAGYKILKLSARNEGGFVAPYLDGDAKYVIDGGNYFRVTDDECEANYKCDNTDGSADEVNCDSCEDCGGNIRDGDGHWAGAHEDVRICDCCRHDHYTYVYGRRGNQYVVNDDNMIEVDGEYYHDEYLSDNDIVELENGEYCHQDNAVCIESNHEWHRVDSDDICHTVDGNYEMREDCVELENGEWCLESEAWCCDHTGDYYQASEHDSVTTKCGKIIHEDHAEHYEMQNDEDTKTVWTPVDTGMTAIEQLTKESNE